MSQNQVLGVLVCKSHHPNKPVIFLIIGKPERHPKLVNHVTVL